MGEWVCTNTAAKILGVGSTTIRRWADENKLQSIRTDGGHRRFDRAHVESIIRQPVPTGGNVTSCDHWIQQLFENRNVDLHVDEISRLHDELGDWFSVADFLGDVIEQIGNHWVDNKCSVVQEHIASNRLDLALGIVSSSIQVPSGAPVCLLATLSNEHHALGLSLTRLCLRSVGIDVVLIGVDTPVDELVAHIKASDQYLLCLSASRWSTDYGFLARANRKIAAACRETNTEYILGGSGAWPEVIEYGYRCNSFMDLRDELENIHAIQY